MDLTALIKPEAVYIDVHSRDKTQLINTLATSISPLCGIPAATVAQVVLERENMGSTGSGHGAAIPHGRFAELSEPVVAMATLAHAVDFDAIDEAPVDLVFLLLSPAESGSAHLKVLSRISKLLRDTETCRKLRACKTPAECIQVLSEAAEPRAA